MTRLSGADRILTSIAVSQDSFPATGAAGAVVLSRSDGFADALAGTPLAVAKNGPLLLTPSGGPIDSRTMAEIQRALTPGKTVYLLGGPAAIDPSVAAALQAAGYNVVRYQGGNRYSTAVSVAHDGLADPPTQLLATGTDFADALAGGAAAANVPGGASILLTNGTSMPPETAAYMAAHPPVAHFALGGPAAMADPTATPIVGADRFETSVKVANTFFNNPVVVGLAYGFNYPDALAGGTHIGAKHSPLLLTDTNSLPATVNGYLTAKKTSINSGYGYGGPVVISDATLTAAQTAYT
jgi:putative cell wall-binding protein